MVDTLIYLWLGASVALLALGIGMWAWIAVRRP